MKKSIKKADEAIDKLIYILERINLTGYIEYLENKNRLIWNNFLIGIARGLGYAIGFSVLGAIVIYILIETGAVNFPAISDFIRQMVG